MATNSVLSAPKVVVSIKPIHSLVAGVMDGIGVPFLLLDTNVSPHGARLKPSQAQAIQNSDVLFWVGPQLETFLSNPMLSLLPKTSVQPLFSLSEISFPPVASTMERDPHIWLDPQNARVIVEHVAVTLSKKDPANQGKYMTNARKLTQNLKDLERDMKSKLSAFREVPFLSFHDAYGHLENRFGLNKGLPITNTPENKPGAAKIAKLQKLVRSQNIRCIFSEPQNNSKILTIIAQESGAKISVIDPLGNDIKEGPSQYFMLMRELGATLVTCLSAK